MDKRSKPRPPRPTLPKPPKPRLPEPWEPARVPRPPTPPKPPEPWGIGNLLDRRRSRILLALVGGVAAAGCATHAGRTAGQAQGGDRFAVEIREDAIPVQRVIPAAEEAVWAVIPRVFQGMGYAGAPSEYREHVYLTPYLAIHDRLYEGDLNSLYFDCGRNPTGPVVADAYAITFVILVRLRPATEGTTLVEVLVDGNAADRAQRAKSVHCTGTGRLEKAILDRLEAQLRSPAP